MDQTHKGVEKESGQERHSPRPCQLHNSYLWQSTILNEVLRISHQGMDKCNTKWSCGPDHMKACERQRSFCQSSRGCLVEKLQLLALYQLGSAAGKGLGKWGLWVSDSVKVLSCLCLVLRGWLTTQSFFINLHPLSPEDPASFPGSS